MFDVDSLRCDLLFNLCLLSRVTDVLSCRLFSVLCTILDLVLFFADLSLAIATPRCRHLAVVLLYGLEDSV